MGLGFAFGRLSAQLGSGSYVLQFDQNADGVPDAKFDHEKGMVSRTQYDRNFDGKWDYFEWYADGTVARAEADDNFDGQADGWLTYQAGNLQQSLHDLDFNGVVDGLNRYRHGVLHAAICRPNGATNHVRIELFRHGALEKEYRDADGDGLLEILMHYDLFGNEARRENLVPALVPTQLKLE